MFGFKVNIKTFAAIREVIGSSQIILDIQDQTKLFGLINEIIKKYPDLDDILIENNRMRNDIILIVNDNQIHHEKIEKTTLKENDVVIILPPAGGG